MMRQRTNEERWQQLVELQDRERRLLACEIHDGFVQDVVGAQLSIDVLLERLLKTDPDAVEPLLRIRAMVRKAIDEARRLIGELRPPLTDDLPLVDAIQSLVHQEESQRRLKVRFTPHLRDSRRFRLEPLQQATILRVVQEAINNVARHAKTRDVEISLTETSSSVRIAIADQGVGFDPRQVAADRYGLTGISERAHLFGGTATIRSQPGKGTVVSVEFPINRGAQSSSPKPPRSKPTRSKSVNSKGSNVAAALASSTPKIEPEPRKARRTRNKSRS